MTVIYQQYPYIALNRKCLSAFDKKEARTGCCCSSYDTSPSSSSLIYSPPLSLGNVRDEKQLPVRTRILNFTFRLVATQPPRAVVGLPLAFDASS